MQTQTDHPTNPVPPPADKRRQHALVDDPLALAEMRRLVEQVFRDGFVATKRTWDFSTENWKFTPDIPVRCLTLETFLETREKMPLMQWVRLLVFFRECHTELIEIASKPKGRRLLLEVGAVDADWLRRYAPATNFYHSPLPTNPKT